MNTQFIQGLAGLWRSEAATLRRRGASAQAELLESCATDLDRGIEELQLEPLNLTEASDLSGYSTDHLGRLVREGKIPNAGRPGAPRIARGDLPITAGVVRRPPSLQISRTEVVRSAISAGD